MTLGTFPQTATYWAISGNDGFGGMTFSSPTTLSVRWQDVSERFIDEAGAEKVSRAKVFLQEDVTLGSYLYLGTSTESSPYDVSGAYEVRSFFKIPSLDGVEFERKAML